MGSGEAVVKGETFQVRAEGRAGVGQAEREQFVQREGTYGMLGDRELCHLAGGWSAVRSSLDGEHADTDRGTSCRTSEAPGVCS